MYLYFLLFLLGRKVVHDGEGSHLILIVLYFMKFKVNCLKLTVDNTYNSHSSNSDRRLKADHKRTCMSSNTTT